MQTPASAFASDAPSNATSTTAPFFRRSFVEFSATEVFLPRCRIRTYAETRAGAAMEIPDTCPSTILSPPSRRSSVLDGPGRASARSTSALKLIPARFGAADAGFGSQNGSHDELNWLAER